MGKVLFAVVTALAGAMIASSAVGQVDPFRTVALSGNPAPGLPDGVYYDSFSPNLFRLSVNDAGQVAFVGALSGTNVDETNDQALFSEGGGLGAVPLARRGEQTAGLPIGLQFGDQIALPAVEAEILLNNAGQTAARAGIEGGTPNINRAIFSDAGGGGLFTLARLRGLVDAIEPIPPRESPRYDFLGQLQFNDAGHTAFRAVVSGFGIDTSNNQVILSESGGNGLEVVVQSGNPAAGVPGAHYTGFFPLRLNNAGQLAFLAGLGGDGVTPSNDWAIYQGSGPDFSLVARGGDQAPGLPSGVVYGQAVPQSIARRLNDAGQVAFVSHLQGTGVFPSNDEAIFAGTSEELNAIVREGEQAGGLNPGVLHDTLGIVQMHNSGHVAFNSFLRNLNVNDTNNQALFSNSAGGSPTAIARTGDQAAGLADGVRYHEFTGSHLINDAGQVAFFANLTDGNSVSGGLFVTDLLGEVRLVTAVGELFDVSDDPLVPDWRTVSALNAFDLSSRHVALWAQFTDGSSGVFVTVVPEPGSAGLFSFIVLLVARYRRAACGCSGP